MHIKVWEALAPRPRFGAPEVSRICSHQGHQGLPMFLVLHSSPAPFSLLLWHELCPSHTGLPLMLQLVKFSLAQDLCICCFPCLALQVLPLSFTCPAVLSFGAPFKQDLLEVLPTQAKSIRVCTAFSILTFV